MTALKLSELPGQVIEDVRYHYVYENEYGMQEFHSYIRLGNGQIIDMPHFDSEEFILLSPENIAYLQRMFDTGQPITSPAKDLFIGQTIIDLHFCYFENEIEGDRRAYMELSNGYFLTENNYGPPGVTDIDLILLDKTQFATEFKRLNNLKIEVRSYTRQNTSL